MWAEADDHLALSFQEVEGCAEIWEKICEVRDQQYCNYIARVTSLDHIILGILLFPGEEIL